MPLAKYMKKLNIDYKVHLIDLIVVIIGVSVAFLISNWAERNKEQNEVRTILNSMANEIRHDIEVYKTHQIPINESNVVQQKKLMDMLYSDTIDQDSLNHYFIDGVLRTNNWSISRSTYLTMQEAGKIAVVKSNKLQLEIRSLYETRYSQSEYVRNLGLANGEGLIDYLNEKIDFQDESTYKEVIGDRKFRNLMSRRYQLSMSKIHEYKNNVKQLEEVLEKIKLELGSYYIEE